MQVLTTALPFPTGGAAVRDRADDGTVQHHHGQSPGGHLGTPSRDGRDRRTVLSVVLSASRHPQPRWPRSKDCPERRSERRSERRPERHDERRPERRSALGTNLVEAEATSGWKVKGGREPGVPGSLARIGNHMKHATLATWTRCITLLWICQGLSAPRTYSTGTRSIKLRTVPPTRPKKGHAWSCVA
jgi:hypothetical protein